MAEFIKVTIYSNSLFTSGEEIQFNVDKISAFREMFEDLTIYEGEAFTVKVSEHPVWIHAEMSGFIFSKLSYKKFVKKIVLLEERRLKKIAKKVSRFQLMDMEEE